MTDRAEYDREVERELEFRRLWRHLGVDAERDEDD